jgi:hypothetical protein
MGCNEGATMIKSYRGQLADGGQDHIRLKTNRGDIGYRIVKFQLFPSAPGVTAQESIMKVLKLAPSSVTGNVNFGDGDLLAASYIRGGGSYSWSETTIFENEVFNQDIFIVHAEESSSNAACNYYFELEQIKLTENESTMATLQSMRQVAEQ